MRVIADMNKFRDHGQCVGSAPQAVPLDDNGKLAFRHDARDGHVCDDLDEPLRDHVEEAAADACPPQAISVEG